MDNIINKTYLDERTSQEILNLYEIFVRAKQLMLLAEEIDPERSALYLQPRLE
jgi:hypothetical protein